MSKETKLTLIDDLRDCGRRARELGLPERALAIHAIADEMLSDLRAADSDRPSLPPVLMENQQTRATASKHFQKTRDILRGIR